MIQYGGGGDYRLRRDGVVSDATVGDSIVFSRTVSTYLAASSFNNSLINIIFRKNQCVDT